MNSQPNSCRACPEFADRLVDLSDGELSAAEWEIVETHVATCAACREELSRLDASLAALREGIVAPQPVARCMSDRRRAALVAAGTAAAILLAIGVASLLKAPTSGRGDSSPASPNPLTTGQGFVGQSFDHESRELPRAINAAAALQQIALIEQQARLEMSLALMPDDEWYAESRTANEELLVRLRQAAQSSSLVRPSSTFEDSL
jgi:anti-sigma factor RsiW